MSLIINDTQRLFNIIGHKFSNELREDVVNVIDDFVLQLREMDLRKEILKDLAQNCKNKLDDDARLTLNWYFKESRDFLGKYCKLIKTFDLEMSRGSSCVKMNASQRDLNRETDLWNGYVQAIEDYNMFYDEIEHRLPDDLRVEYYADVEEKMPGLKLEFHREVPVNQFEILEQAFEENQMELEADRNKQQVSEFNMAKPVLRRAEWSVPNIPKKDDNEDEFYNPDDISEEDINNYYFTTYNVNTLNDENAIE